MNLTVTPYYTQTLQIILFPVAHETLSEIKNIVGYK